LAHQFQSKYCCLCLVLSGLECMSGSPEKKNTLK
jgi:hypothetical protein